MAYTSNINKNQNKHHLNWERRPWEKNNVLRRLRDHQGMVIPMNIYNHREIHSDLMPPPKPSQQQAEELFDHLGVYDNQSERIDYLDIAVNFMRSRNALYASHLIMQRSYVLLTPFTQTERDIVAAEREMAAS